jgi:hypothetical protein
MARAASGRRYSSKPEVPVSSAAKRETQASVLAHDVAEPQNKLVLVTSHWLAVYPLRQEGPLATAFSNRELLVLEHASTH